MTKELFTEAEAKEICRRYSLAAALRNLAGTRESGGYEIEISKEFNKRADRPDRGTLTIPGFVLAAHAEKRDGGTMNYANGSAFVQTDLLGDQFINALTARTVLGKCGISKLGGLRGDVSIPKLGAVSAAWIPDGDSAPAVVPSTAQVTGAPHTVGGMIDFSRRLVLQSSVAVETIVSNAVLDAIAREIERAAFVGTGADGQPTGLANVTGVQTATLSATPTKAELVTVWKKILAANANGAKMAFVASPDIYAALSQTLDVKTIMGEGETPVAAVTAGKYLVEDGRCEGYPIHPSNLCGSSLWFGDWSEAMLCAWSGVDLRVDPYSLSASGGVRIVALQDVDFIVRHPEAFVMATVSAD